MAGQPTGERQDGIPIADAAALLGLSAEAVRKRIQRGTLDGHKRAGHWFVVIERQDEPSGRPDAVRTERQDTSGQRPDDTPVEAAYRVTPAEIEQAVSRTSAQYMGDLRAMLAEVGKVYEGQIAAKDQVITAQTEIIAQLRRDRARIEAERDRLAAAQAAQNGAGASGGVSAGSPTPEPSAGFWARLRRVFGGRSDR